jgi:hypothetical protein
MKDPFEVLKSKRFISAVAGLLVILLVSVAPELQNSEAFLVESITVIVTLLIGGYTITDAVKDYLATYTAKQKLPEVVQGINDLIEKKAHIDIPDEVVEALKQIIAK